MSNSSEQNPPKPTKTSLKNIPGVFGSAREALGTFQECSAALTDFLESLNSSREELQRETDALRDRERRLSEEVTKLRGVDELLEKQKLVLSEAERRRLAHEDEIRSAQDELTAKSEALTQLRDEYKEVLERLNSLTTDVETTKVGLSDSERKRSHFEELAEHSQRDLREKKKELSELTVKVLEQTSTLNEAQARLQEMEEALQRSNQELVSQAQELKETKWELLQQREELRVTKGELTRKTAVLEERERDLEQRTEALRTQQDTLADLERDLTRSTRRVSEHEEALTRANEKIAEQGATLGRLDKELAKVQEEVEQRRRALRLAEEKLKLEESERTGIEQDLSVTRDALKKKSDALENQEKRGDDLRRRFDTEVQKRREAEEQRDRSRAEVSAIRDELRTVQETVNGANERARTAEEDALRAREDFERLQHEHKNLLRVEMRQAGELEQLGAEIHKKSEGLREWQTQAAALRERFDLLTLKYDQQAMALVEAQQKLARQQDELQTFKRQLQKATRLPQLDAELAEAKQELSARDLRLEQQEQLIRVLQNRLGEKRVVPLTPREGSPANTKHGSQKHQPADAEEPGTRELNVTGKGGQQKASNN